MIEALLRNTLLLYAIGSSMIAMALFVCVMVVYHKVVEARVLRNTPPVLLAQRLVDVALKDYPTLEFESDDFTQSKVYLIHDRAIEIRILHVSMPSKSNDYTKETL